MDAVRVLAEVVLAVPTASFVDRVSSALVVDRPLFRPAASSRVSPRPLAIGAVLVVLFGLAAVRFAESSWLETFAYLALFAVLLLLSLVDVAEYRLPDVVVLPSILVGFVTVALVSVVDGTPDRIRTALVGSVVAFAVLLAAHLVSPRGMGFGDVKLAVLLGLAVGWQGSNALEAVVLVLWMLLIGFGVGSLAGVVLWIVRRSNRPFPFGPFLALGTVATVLLAPSLVG